MSKKTAKKTAKKATKKVAKKAVKKTAKKATTKKAAKKVAKKAAKKRPATTQPTNEQISHVAYLNYIDRQQHGIHGDHTSDWLAAEDQLRNNQS